MDVLHPTRRPLTTGGILLIPRTTRTIALRTHTTCTLPRPIDTMTGITLTTTHATSLPTFLLQIIATTTGTMTVRVARPRLRRRPEKSATPEAKPAILATQPTPPPNPATPATPVIPVIPVILATQLLVPTIAT